MSLNGVIEVEFCTQWHANNCNLLASFLFIILANGHDSTNKGHTSLACGKGFTSWTDSLQSTLI